MQGGGDGEFRVAMTKAYVDGYMGATAKRACRSKTENCSCLDNYRLRRVRAILAELIGRDREGLEFLVKVRPMHA